MSFSEVSPNPYLISGGLIRPEMQMCFVISINVGYLLRSWDNYLFFSSVNLCSGRIRQLGSVEKDLLNEIVT